MTEKKRFAIVGTGNRATSYVSGFFDWVRDETELCGLCDPSQVRMDWHNERIAEMYGGEKVPTYRDFDLLLEKQAPDVVIVTTPDYTHHEYACHAIERGVRVHCEKPMTVDLPTTQKVIDTVEKNDGDMVVSLNLRYSNLYKKVNELLSSGLIGQPKFICLTETLDSSHGADYFRRWHRDKKKSGGFLIQKSSHHFDLVNWWLKSYPKTVFAVGDLLFYGRENALARGIDQSYERYTGVSKAADDFFALDLDNSGDLNKGLYRNAESDSDYIRDRNVFGEGITIEDTVSAVTRYENGVIFNYTLVAYATYDGLKATITGTEGRIELEECFSPHIASRVDGKIVSKRAEEHHLSLRVHPMFSAPYEVEIPEGGGGHGGGDQGIMRASFAPKSKDETAHLPTVYDGAAASILGIAANLSMETGNPIDCADLLSLKPAAENGS